MNNLTQFGTLAEYNDFLNSNDCPYVNVSYIGETDEVKYFRDEVFENEYFNMPFTIEITSIGQDEPNCTLFLHPDMQARTDFKYKINDGEWQEWPINSNEYVQINDLVVGDKVQVLNINNRTTTDGQMLFGEIDIWRNNNFDDRIGGSIKIYGNPFSLVNGSNFRSVPEMFNEGGQGYFYNWLSNGRVQDILTDAENLWLPTRSLSVACFREMFKEFTHLVKAPNILAKHLPQQACQGMFEGCTSLTDMPIIAAETVESNALSNMFYGCSSLANVTPLHIKRNTGYNPVENMFRDCTSLTTTPVWNETIICPEGELNGGICNTFSGCTSLTDASPIHITLNISERNGYVAYWNMMNNTFDGCTSLVTGPYIEINGRLDDMGADNIFYNCENLESFTFLCSHYNFSFGLDNNTKNGTWYYRDGVDYNPAEKVPGSWTCTPVTEN